MTALDEPRDRPLPRVVNSEINIVKLRAKLSRLEGRLVLETDARLYIVNAGFLPARDDRWTGTDAGFEEIRAFCER